MEATRDISINISELVRKNIAQLTPYTCARDEFKGNATVYLDANENALGSPLNTDYSRYPDAYQTRVKEEIAKLKSVDPEQIFLGNGSDEAIDLLFRAFCEPGMDQVIITPPTYGMYKVQADINNISTKEVLLNRDFSYPLNKVLASISENTKLIFICSPNNPTGQLVDKEIIETILNEFNGIVVVDEAYIDFSSSESTLELLAKYNNLVVLQTFSKAWGLAGLRAGLAIGNKDIIRILNTIKYPYNVNSFTQNKVLEALQNVKLAQARILELNQNRKELSKALSKFPFISKVYPSEANFILIKVENADLLYLFLSKHGIVVRNRNKQALCENCLRITIGNKMENSILLKTLAQFNNEN